MRRIEQPGPALTPRIQAAQGEGRAFRFTLRPGEALLAGAAAAFAREGFSSGVLRLRGGGFGPFAYVQPSLPVSPRNAAYYSDVFRPAGVARLDQGAMTLGQRDGLPFFHCHALWTEAAGRLSGGHILPEECVVALPVEVEAVGLDGAGFVGEDDAETNFRLFQPCGGRAEGRFFALRLRPNQEFGEALEGFCRAGGIARARLHGGVGSTIGARYADGRVVQNYATEMFLTAGEIDTAGDATRIDIGLVDYTGAVSAGRLLPGDNPVLMTMELVLEALA